MTRYYLLLFITFISILFLAFIKATPELGQEPAISANHVTISTKSTVLEIPLHQIESLSSVLTTKFIEMLGKLGKDIGSDDKLKKDLFGSKGLQHGEIITFEIAVIPSRSKYSITCERLADKTWGHYYRVVVDPYNEQEDVWEYRFVVPHIGKIDVDLQDDEKEEKGDADNLMHIFENIFRSNNQIHHKFHKIDSNDDNFDANHHRHFEYDIEFLHTKDRARFIVDSKGKNRYGRVFTLITRSLTIDAEYEVTIVVPYEEYRD
ncbi:1780_t:CDS:2 [Ambispora gerdemannii]|uniref:1780_t:CDS:1 n=1 Tax=Ambispora gerdemannii TaxID=144530 RepID=A0A9N9B106_9GLOM|nr:1780_t:CDS:2 [Ambispora gerdemannii]